MFFEERTIMSPKYFNSRFVQNFVYSIMNMKSFPYMSTVERNVNAKSVLGLLSLNIHQGDIIRIQVCNNDIEQAKKDLDFIIELIQGDD